MNKQVLLRLGKGILLTQVGLLILFGGIWFIELLTDRSAELIDPNSVWEMLAVNAGFGMILLLLVSMPAGCFLREAWEAFCGTTDEDTKPKRSPF